MTHEKLNEIKTLIQTDDSYKSFRENEKVKDKLHLLCVSGSYAYGTNREDSDIDIRGVVALDPKYANGTLKDWETKDFSETDTTIHSYKKMLRLITVGNPDILAIIGQDLDQYLYLSDLGKELVLNHSDFIGANGVYRNFIGYSNDQMRRLELAEIGRLAEKKELVKDIKESILKNAAFKMHVKYNTLELENLSINFNVPESEDEKVMINELILKDVNIDDFFDIAKDFKNIVNSFGKKGKRNTKKSDFKLNKHCMHTVRGILMGIEVLETGKVVTNRAKDLPLLWDILNGKYMYDDGKMRPEFYELVDDLRLKANYAYKNSVLPPEPDINRVSDMMTEFVLHDLKRKEA